MVTLGDIVLYPLLIAIALASTLFLIYFLIKLLIRAKAFISLSLGKAKITHVHLAVLAGSILTCWVSWSVTIDLFAVFNLSVIVGSISAIFLVLIFISRSTLTTAQNLTFSIGLKWRYILPAVVIGSVLSLFIFGGMLILLATNDISSIRRALRKADQLKVYNTFPQNSAPHGWGTQELDVTDKETIEKVSDVFSNCQFELQNAPGRLATCNGISFFIFEDGRKIEQFGFLSATLYTRNSSFVYWPSNKPVVIKLREAVGAKDSELE